MFGILPCNFLLLVLCLDVISNTSNTSFNSLIHDKFKCAHLKGDIFFKFANKSNDSTNRTEEKMKPVV